MTKKDKERDAEEWSRMNKASHLSKVATPEDATSIIATFQAGQAQVTGSQKKAYSLTCSMTWYLCGDGAGQNELDTVIAEINTLEGRTKDGKVWHSALKTTPNNSSQPLSTCASWKNFFFGPASWPTFAGVWVMFHG